MSARSRLVSRDEELGKRDDDFKPRRSRSPSMLTVPPWRWRKRRIVVVVALVVLIYVFVHNVPTGIEERMSAGYGQPDPYAAVARKEPSGAPPRDGSVEEDVESKHYYNGIVKFYKLASSLHKISRGMGNLVHNRNVLFAASSLASAANLLPMACEMARIDRNDVHFAVFGRSTLTLDDIIAINGIDDNDCNIHFHDARGDYAEYSSEARVESATRGAMKHINDFMHPQAIIMDDSAEEDGHFTRAMRQKAKELHKALIEVPKGRYEDFLWMTRLDAGSLSSWFDPSIEIVIHAPPASSGSLIRLLKSLKDADYSGLMVPKLTIELPSNVDSILQHYLSDYDWPPQRTPNEPSTLTLRHRIPSSRASSEQASIRFVESFYPRDAGNDHLLVLSPQVELSPLYLQFLYYHILEYRYTSWGSPGGEDLLGISLDVPTVTVDGKNTFAHPRVTNTTYSRSSQDVELETDAPSPFSYQAASSTASLIFGENWAVFHDFLSKRIEASHSGKKGRTEKLVSAVEPAWVEYLLELMRARNWFMLHPIASFVTVHNELAQVPEEYAKPPASDAKATEMYQQSAHPDEESFILSAESPAPIERVETDPTRDLMPLHRMLPLDGEPQQITDLPYVSHQGKITSYWNMTEARDEYVPWFRAAIGGCQGDQATRKRHPHGLKTDDLFCLPGIDVEADEDDDDDVGDHWAAHVAQAIAESTDEEANKAKEDRVEAQKLATVPTKDEVEGGEKKLDAS